jgi:hypothetical protein
MSIWQRLQQSCKKQIQSIIAKPIVTTTCILFISSSEDSHNSNVGVTLSPALSILFNKTTVLNRYNYTCDPENENKF